MSAESTTQNKLQSLPWASILIAGIAAIIASMVANLIVRSIGIRIFDVPGGFEPLATAGPIVMASITYGIMATIAFTITSYFASNLRRTWLIVSGIGLLVSFIPALAQGTQDDSNAAAVIILIFMHIVAAAITIPTMLRLAGK